MSFSQGFLPELLYVMHADTEMNIFETIINDCLSFIRVAAQLNHSKSEYVIRPLACLKDLVSFMVPNTKIRPIATLLPARFDWLPNDFINEKAKANEIVATCFLGPFINVDIMDDWQLLEQYKDITELTPPIRMQVSTQLRNRLEGPRAEMFQIVETMLKNVPSRDKMIGWLCKMAQMNIKRAGMHVVDHEMAPISFILNILHVTHQMSKKIDVNKGKHHFILGILRHYYVKDTILHNIFSRRKLSLSSCMSGQAWQ